MSSKPPPSSTPQPSILSSTTSLMALQLFSRLFTFALNQALFRLASPRAFGAASIQFELLLSTVLFLSREGVRGAVLRGGSPTLTVSSAEGKEEKASEEITKVKRTNLSFLPLLVGIPLSLVTTLVYSTFLAGEEVRAQPGFQSAVGLYALAAVLELVSEPLYNLAMAELKTSIRVRAEGLGITFKSIVTFLVLVYDSRRGSGGEYALLAFALGQVAYSTVMLLVYVRYLGMGYLKIRKPPSVAGKSKETGWMSYIDKDTLYLSFTMTYQSLVKHFLTEGDKVILSWFSPLQDQGGYALAVNYGSLVARIIFQPIEESLRLFFSRTLGNSSSSSNSDPNSNPESASASASASPPSSITSAATTLHTLLSTQTSLSFILVTFAPPYLPILLPILLPAQYLSTSAPSVLQAWVWYIPVLAVNGGLEAFLASVAGREELNKQSRWMVGFSAVYILSAILLYRAGLGDASLVYANIANLTARIVYALRFTSRFFNSRGAPFKWQSALVPSTSLWVASLVSAVLVRLSGRWLRADEVAAQLGRRALFAPAVLLHVGVGGVLGVVCVGVWWMKEGRHLGIGRMRRGKAD